MVTPSLSSAPRARRCHRYQTVVLALYSAFIGLNAHAQPALTLEQALRLAQDRSRQLVAQDAAAAASRDLAIAAGQLPDPTLKLGVNNLPVNGPDQFSLTRDFMTMSSIGVMQELTSADKRKARTTLFEREAEVAEAGRVVALADLRRDTVIAWLDRYFQERIREVLVTQRDEAGLQVEAADAAYRGGRGAQADVFAARSAVAQIDDRIRQTEQRILTATTRLARWVGNAASHPLAPPPSRATVRFASDHLDTALAHHPQIELLARQEQVARAEADIAQRNKHSDWSVELMYSQRGSAYSNMISLNFSIPLQLDQTNRQDRDLAAKLAKSDQLRAQREEATRGHAAEIRTWLQQWQSNRDRLEHYDSALIPLAGERTRAALAAYRGGGGPLNAVLESRRMEIEVRMERIRLEMETADVWARLEYAIPADYRAATPYRPALARTTATEK